VRLVVYESEVRKCVYIVVYILCVFLPFIRVLFVNLRFLFLVVKSHVVCTFVIVR